MNHFRLRSFAIAVTIITYLLSFAGTAPAGILCFGEDGHVSMDSAPSLLSPAGVHFVNTHTDDSEQTPGHCEDDCNACFDIPISASHVQNIAPPNNGFHIALMPSAAFWDAILPPYAQKITNSNLYDPPPHRNKTITSLRTIIFLI